MDKHEEPPKWELPRERPADVPDLGKPVEEFLLSRADKLREKTDAAMPKLGEFLDTLGGGAVLAVCIDGLGFVHLMKARRKTLIAPVEESLEAIETLIRQGLDTITDMSVEKTEDGHVLREQQPKPSSGIEGLLLKLAEVAIDKLHNETRMAYKALSIVYAFAFVHDHERARDMARRTGKLVMERGVRQDFTPDFSKLKLDELSEAEVDLLLSSLERIEEKIRAKYGKEEGGDGQ